MSYLKTAARPFDILAIAGSSRTKTMLTLVVVLLCVPMVVFGQSCITNPYSDGCSIPGDLPFFYKDTFTQDCNIHDICYFCATMYGKTRAQCDKAFENNMEASCHRLSKRFLITSIVNFAACESASLTYYEAVRIGAQSHFESAAPSWCMDPWVKQCLP